MRILADDYASWQSDLTDDVLAQQQAEMDARQQDIDAQIRQQQAEFEQRMAEMQQAQWEAEQGRQWYDTQSSALDASFPTPAPPVPDYNQQIDQLGDFSGVGGGHYGLNFFGSGYTPRDNTEVSDTAPGDTLTFNPEPAPEPVAQPEQDLGAFGYQDWQAGPPEPPPVVQAPPPPPAPEPVPAARDDYRLPQPQNQVQQFSPFDDVFVRNMPQQLQGNPEFLSILAAATLAESGWDPNNRTGDGGRSWGLFQIHSVHLRPGDNGQWRNDPDTATQYMMGRYVDAYNKYKALGYSGAQLAGAVSAEAERPYDWQNPNGTAQQNYRVAYNRIVGGNAPTGPVTVAANRGGGVGTPGDTLVLGQPIPEGETYSDTVLPPIATTSPTVIPDEEYDQRPSPYAGMSARERADAMLQERGLGQYSSAFEGVRAGAQIYEPQPEPSLPQRALGTLQSATAAVGSVPIAPGPNGPITLGDVGGTLDDIRRQAASQIAMPAQFGLTYPEQIANEQGDYETQIRNAIAQYGADDPRTQALVDAHNAQAAALQAEPWLDVARRNPAYENVVGATDLGLQAASFAAAPELAGGLRGAAAALLDPAQQLGNVPFAAAGRLGGALARVPGLAGAPGMGVMEPERFAGTGANRTDEVLTRLQDQIEVARRHVEQGPPEEAAMWSDTLKSLVDEYDSTERMLAQVDRLLAQSPSNGGTFTGSRTLDEGLTNPAVERGVMGAVAGGYSASQDEDATPESIALGAGLTGLTGIAASRGAGRFLTNRIHQLSQAANPEEERVGDQALARLRQGTSWAPETFGDEAAAKVRQGYQGPGSAGIHFSFENIKNDFDRLIFNDRADLKSMQGKVDTAYQAANGGAPLPYEMRALEFDRLSRGANGRAGLRVQNDLMPVIDALTPPQQATLRDAMTLANDIDIAKAIEKDFGKETADARRFSNGLTRAELEPALLSLERNTSPEDWAKVDDAARSIYTNYVDPLRDRMYESGAWSAELTRSLKNEFPHYMPTVIADHLDDPRFIPPGQKIGLGDIGLKHLTAEGTNAAREDPFVSLMRMAFENERRAAKNETAQAIYNWREVSPEFADVMRVLGPGDHARKGEVVMPFFRDGEKIEIATSQPIADAISFMGPGGISGIPNSAAGKGIARYTGADLLRMGATERNPLFAIAKNPILDFPTYLTRMEAEYGASKTLEIGKAYGQALADSFKGFGTGRVLGEARQRFYRGGGAQAGVYSNATEDLQAWVGKLSQPSATRDPGAYAKYMLDNPHKLARAIWDATTFKWTGEIGSRLEDTPRVAAMLMKERYGAAPQAGVLARRAEDLGMGDLRLKSLSAPGQEAIAGGAPVARTAPFGRPLEASGDALPYGPRSTPFPNLDAIVAGRQVTQDFGDGGQLTKVLNLFIPYTNVAFQTLPWMWQVAKQNPKGAVATFATLVGAPTIAAEAWNRADPEREAAYEDVPDWIKQQSIVVMKPEPWTAPNERGQRRPDMWLIPMRTGAPLMVGAREATRSAMTGEPPESWGKLLSQLVGSASPIQAESGTQLLGLVMPVALGTATQLATNMNFFTGGAIKSQANDIRALAPSQAIAQGVSEHTPVDLAPAQVEFTARETGAGLAGIYLAAADLAAKLKDQRSLVPYNAGPSELPGAGGLIGAFNRQSGGQTDIDLQHLRDQTQDRMTDNLMRGMDFGGNRGIEDSTRQMIHREMRQVANAIVFSDTRDPTDQLRQLEKELRAAGVSGAEMSAQMAALRDVLRQTRGNRRDVMRRLELAR